MSPALITPFVLLAVLLLTVGWVYRDAGRHVADGEPVVLRAGTMVVTTPAAWAALCLVLWVFAFPLYLRARQRTL
jgi:hypothetical protein